ncbi:6-carboxytetrahydropterin synthase [Streptomyces sp. TRM66268-LWL]|uniref:6-carboxy-5,6,7,8-tetrahydropterin synthase n=1 Tax=Streptomyces polyasparticus TaxID=2767826 RepID=A0ABR7SV05_9ACTN|nr:6-carboxytetrahydropterin synthase [Streptomyces polyasparticus]MBC9718437.1 6-carboxytetrahydropterin synthase [Streptomyces polyasparticus]
MRYTVQKKIGPISAMHAINSLPEGHECRNLHGHNLYVDLTLGADKLTEPGFVIDFNDLAPVETYLRSWSRMESLGELFPDGRDATVEHLAEHVADWYATNIAPTAPSCQLLSVTVHETDTCSATYTTTAGLEATR